MENIYPVITLYQPWATWIMREWKTIETRTHKRFACLKNKTILIHAGQKTDAAAINNPYLTKAQLLQNPDEMVNGYILGSAFVSEFSKLSEADSEKSLIECITVRYGLHLVQVEKFEVPIPVKGEMGIWYYDLSKREKVKKSDSKAQTTLWDDDEDDFDRCGDCDGHDACADFGCAIKSGLGHLVQPPL